MILDTNALSAVADNHADAVRVFTQADTIELPFIVLGEYRFGIAHSRHRSDYEKWLEELVSATRFLPADDQTAGHYAILCSELKKAGKPIPSNDIWIAALSRQYRLPLMTRDAHFDHVRGLKRVAW